MSLENQPDKDVLKTEIYHKSLSPPLKIERTKPALFRQELAGFVLFLTPFVKIHYRVIQKNSTFSALTDKGDLLYNFCIETYIFTQCVL